MDQPTCSAHSGLETRWLEDRGIGIRFPEGGRIFFLHSIALGSEDYLISCLNYYQCSPGATLAAVLN